MNDIGVERWQYDLWYEIIRAALEGHPDQVDLSYHEALNQPACKPLWRDHARPIELVLSIQ